MRLTTLLTVIGSLTVLALTGCENCGPSAEPLLYLNINDAAGSTTFDTLYALGGRGPIPRQPYTNGTTLRTGQQLVLPINLNVDSTRYVFRLSGRQDTVTVFYQRKTAYRNRKCGYVLDLYEPELGPKARTSRGKVEGVSYLQNRDASFPGSRQNTSIFLGVRL